MDDLPDLSQSQKIGRMINEGHLCDCKFVVGPYDENSETVFGNKILLAMESPVMESLLFGDFVEANGKSETRIIDANGIDFKEFCSIIYQRSPSRIIQLPIKNMLNVFRLFDKYMVNSMSKLCANHIREKKYLANIPIEDLLTIFEFSHDVQDKTLLQAVQNEISSKKQPIVDQLTNLSEKAFYDYIRIISK